MQTTITSTARRILSEYDRVRVDFTATRHFSHDVLHAAIGRIADASGGAIGVREAGSSFEGRSIRVYTVGTGATNVLLWSQMHGDESTATMAIVDILNDLVSRAGDGLRSRICSALKLHFLPMLNPDGAAAVKRRTAQNIDMNRDARALVTPEANILRRMQKTLRPSFAFNLHDQELSTAGTSGRIAAISLLAPACNDSRNDNPVRTKAKRLAAAFALSLSPAIKGRIARYDDTFEPRAFGDNFQLWKTSTLLVESGHAIGDPEKMFIRKINYAGLLTSLHELATGRYLRAPLRAYESLPVNGKKAYDLIVRNVVVDHGNGRMTTVDLGISRQVDTHSEGPARIVDMGDLSTFAGLREIDGKGKALAAGRISPGAPFDWEEE